jgi:transglutaminase-like putative cysteine protease
MKCSQLLTILFFTLFFFKGNAQEFKLGKVSVEELQEKNHPTDSTAVAAILFEKGVVDFEYSQNDGFVMITEVTTRIKIYKKEGYDWANKAVRYYIGSNAKETVFISDAITYNLINGKIEKTKLKSDGEFDEKVNKYWGRKKITMPNVKVGSVVEFKYRMRSSRFSELTEWSFQSSIPVNFSEFKTFIPEYFVYSPNLKGFISPKITTEKHNKIISYSYRPEAEPGESTTSSSSQEKLEFSETRTAYLAENLPAMKEEAYVNNIANYSTSISHELSVVRFPNQPYKTLSTDWASVTKTIYDYDDFGPELNKTGYFEEDLKLVIAGLNTPEEKITAILNYVKTTVKWNDYYGYSCNDGVKKAYKDKTGNVAEINLMLTAMLRHIGLTANPVLVSTRSNGIALFPNRTAFNYVIAAVEMANGLVLLDASDRFSTPNVLPLRALNWVGRLIRKDGTSIEVDLMPKASSNDVVVMNYEIDANGKVSGDLKRQRTDYNAMIFREKVVDVKEDIYLEKLENENNKIEINEYSRTSEKDLKAPIVEMFSYSGSNFSEIIAGSIYINPMLFFAVEQNPFKQENREYPIDYGFPFIDRYSIAIKIPAGYKVETIPTPLLLNMQDNLGSFKFIINASGNLIQLVIAHQINTPIITPEYYPMLKEFYQKMIEKQNEKIVLIKV